MLRAVVTAIGPLRVRVDGADSDTSALTLVRGDGWAPAVGAYVLVLRLGSRLVVLGEVA